MAKRKRKPPSSRLGEKKDSGQGLMKKVVLHLKEYDTAPLNCTVIFIAQKLEEDRSAIFDTVQKLLDKGIISEWDQWKKGVVTPYRLLSISRLIDQGVELSYEEIRLLTDPQGGHHKDTPLIVASGFGGPSSFMYSSWAKDNLREISMRISRMGIVEGIGPKREYIDPGSGEDMAHDLELGYLNIFFRAQFFADEIEPLYTLYSKKGEKLEDFRKRTIQKLLHVLTKMSESLLTKVDAEKNEQRTFVLFFCCMLERYIELAEKSGIEAGHIKKLDDARKRIIAQAGGTN